MKHRHAIWMLAALMAGGAAMAANEGDPSEVNLKIEAMWVSENADCTGAVQVFEQMPAVYRDMTQNPVFGTANIDSGTYRCLVFRMSDRIEGRSAYQSDGGHCTDGMQVVLDIFRNGNVSTCPDGSQVTATSGEDTPCVYFSTSGVNDSDPYAPGQALPLSGEYVVTADGDATFVTDFRGKVVDTGNQCDIFPPVFAFRSTQ